MMQKMYGWYLCNVLLVNIDTNALPYNQAITTLEGISASISASIINNL